MSEDADFFGTRLRDCELAQALELNRGIGDGVVETAVEELHLRGRNLHVEPVRERCNYLTNIAVAVHDLRDGEAPSAQLVFMFQRRAGQRVDFALLSTHYLRELLEKAWNAVQ